MITKKECIRAFSVICCGNETGEGIEGIYPYLKPEIDTLIELIHEHFSNPPLKFEELKAGMWVWDNKEKRYSKIESFAGIQIYFYDYTDDFEENRFYRKQVE